MCGHYGCGGVRAAMENVDHGLLEHWLLNIRNVQRLHLDELQARRRCCASLLSSDGPSRTHMQTFARALYRFTEDVRVVTPAVACCLDVEFVSWWLFVWCEIQCAYPASAHPAPAFVRTAKRQLLPPYCASSDKPRHGTFVGIHFCASTAAML